MILLQASRCMVAHLPSDTAGLDNITDFLGCLPHQLLWSFHRSIHINIIGALVLFQEHLKKHEQTTNFIHQNLSAQDNIIRALTDANAKYANIRCSSGETVTRHEAMIKDLIHSYDVYEDLLAKSQKGLEFYRKLENNITRLFERCQRVCKVHQEERDQVMARHKPKEPAYHMVTLHRIQLR